MLSGEKAFVGIGIIIIIFIGSLMGYVLFNYDVIKEQQYYLSLKYNNAR